MTGPEKNENLRQSAYCECQNVTTGSGIHPQSSKQQEARVQRLSRQRSVSSGDETLSWSHFNISSTSVHHEKSSSCLTCVLW